MVAVNVDHLFYGRKKCFQILCQGKMATLIVQLPFYQKNISKAETIYGRKKLWRNFRYRFFHHFKVGKNAVF